MNDFNRQNDEFWRWGVLIYNQSEVILLYGLKSVSVSAGP
jgi:hypothetical protein